MAFDDILNSVYSKAAGFNPGGNMSLLVPSNCFAPNPELGTWPQKTPARQKLFPGGSVGKVRVYSFCLFHLWLSAIQETDEKVSLLNPSSHLGIAMESEEKQLLNFFLQSPSPPSSSALCPDKRPTSLWQTALGQG